MGDVIYFLDRLHHPHWIGQCANSKLVTDTGSHVTLHIHLMYSMPPTFDHRLYSIYGLILSLYHKLLVLAMAEVGTHDDLAAYEIQDVVGLEDATERGRGSFGAVYEVEVYGVPCVAKCLHDILIGYQQQFKGPMKLDEEGVDAIRSKF